MALLGRWRRMTLLARFTVTGVCLTALIALVLGWALARAQEGAALDQEAEATAESARLILDPFLRPDDLTAPLTPERLGALDRLVRERLVGAHTVRIKVWSADGTTRYSTEPAEIGERFDLADN